MDINYLTRQLDLIPVGRLSDQVAFVGSGSVGSFSCLSLCKMGFSNVIVYDDDVVSEENLNCQFFKPEHIGQPKVLALQALIREFTGTNIYIRNSKFDFSIANNILVSCVDNMESRKQIFDFALKNCNYFIDARMGITPDSLEEHASLYCINTKNEDDIKSYKTTLHGESEGVQERCTAKATMYTPLLLAGGICKIIKDIVNKKPYANFTQYNIAQNKQISNNATIF